MLLEKLQALLELGKWQDADRKTTEIMLEALTLPHLKDGGFLVHRTELTRPAP